MIRSSLFVFALLVALATSACSATVLFVGDSLTAGLGLDPAQAYPAQVESLARADGLTMSAINAGVSGDTTAGALRRIDWLLTRTPDIVVIALGGNDGLRGTPVATTREQLDAIIRRSVAAGARVVLAGMQLPINYGPDYRDAFATIYPDLAAAHGVVLLPFLLAGVGGVADMNQGDGIHPNAAGQQVIACTVYAVLKPLLIEIAASRPAER